MESKEPLMITPKEAARLVGCTPRHIINHVRDGELPGVKIGHSWYVNRRKFYEYLGVGEAAR